MIKKLIAFALASSAAASTLGQTNVGVSIGINQPGLYGRIDIGDFAQPRVIYSQPIVIVPTPVSALQRPIYLYVPPGHQKKWDKYCGRYNACGQPVYFCRRNGCENVMKKTMTVEAGVKVKAKAGVEAKTKKKWEKVLAALFFDEPILRTRKDEMLHLP